MDFYRAFTASDMHTTWQWAKQTDAKVFTTPLAFQWRYGVSDEMTSTLGT